LWLTYDNCKKRNNNNKKKPPKTKDKTVNILLLRTEAVFPKAVFCFVLKFLKSHLVRPVEAAWLRDLNQWESDPTRPSPRAAVQKSRCKLMFAMLASRG
jgi:hypothetical protein